MNPIRTMLLIFVSLFATSLLAVENSPPQPGAKKLNVLFIAVDDLRDWVGYLHHNEQTKTPNIDRLAKMGVAFTHSYCAAPVCNPSRAALMSGLRPFTSGVYENNNDWRTVIPEPLTLTHQFRGAGYFVAGAGKIYHESYRRRSEWDDYLENEGGKGGHPLGDGFPAEDRDPSEHTAYGDADEVESDVNERTDD